MLKFIRKGYLAGLMVMLSIFCLNNSFVAYSEISQNREMLSETVALDKSLLRDARVIGKTSEAQPCPRRLAELTAARKETNHFLLIYSESTERWALQMVASWLFILVASALVLIHQLRHHESKSQ